MKTAKNIEIVKGRSFIMTFDYHTHTTFSHGKGSIEDNVKVAVEKGLEGLAISDHGPGHLFYGIKREAVPEMRREIERLKPLYPQLNIYLSVEANIIDSDNYLDVKNKEIKDYDFVHAGYHYGVKKGRCICNWLYGKEVFPGKERKKALEKFNTEITVGAIYENHIKILTHPGDKGPFNMDELAKACAERGTLMEISTHHRNLTVEEIKVCSKYDVKFVVSSDAHVPHKVGTFAGGVQRAIDAGLDLGRIVNIKEI